MKKIMLVSVMVLGATCAFADTVYFADGSSLDGIVSHPNDTTILINIGTRSLTIDASTVSRVEPNDNKGDEAALVELLARQQQQALAARTGMSEEDRDRVRDALAPLRSSDEAARTDAHKNLKDLSATLPVFQYIDATLPYTKGPIVPELLAVLTELDAPRAKDVLSRYTINLDPSVRAKVIELLAAYKDPDDVGTIASGMVDLDSSVKLRTTVALGVYGQKTVTPVLIQGLDNADPQIKNAALASLQQIWSADAASAGLTTTSDWSTYWAGKSADVSNPVDPATLKPLVTQEQLDKATASHDE